MFEKITSFFPKLKIAPSFRVKLEIKEVTLNQVLPFFQPVHTQRSPPSLLMGSSVKSWPVWSGLA